MRSGSQRSGRIPIQSTQPIRTRRGAAWRCATAAALASLCAALTLGSTACTGETSQPRLTDADLPRPIRESAFRDHVDLLNAIRDGSFVERAGLEAVIEEARTPPPPETVRVDFVMGTDVPDDQASKLHELAQLLAERDDVFVDVLGCSDPSGPEALNLRISQARAESVAWALEEYGLPADRLGEIEGRGESCPVQERAVFLTSREAEVTSREAEAPAPGAPDGATADATDDA